MKAVIDRIKWLDGQGNMKAFLDIKFDDMMIVKGWKIMDGQNGRWLAAPSRKGKDKEGVEKWFPDVTFSSKETQQGFQDHILSLADKGREGGDGGSGWSESQASAPKQDGFEEADRHMQGSPEDQSFKHKPAQGEAPKNNIAKCKSCGADIVWLKTQNGKNCPVDAGSVPEGYQGTYDRTAMVSHFETCPNADQH